jgi:hypothetical protein
MSPRGRPTGEMRSAEHEGLPMNSIDHMHDPALRSWVESAQAASH